MKRKNIVIITSNPESLNTDPDARIFLEKAREKGYKISIMRGEEEFLAIGPFGASHSPREASILILRYDNANKYNYNKDKDIN